VPDLAEAYRNGEWYDGGGTQTVPAGLIRELLLAEPPPAAQLRIRGARIEGCLDLNFVSCAVPLLIEDCELTDAPRLYWARLGYFSLLGSRLPGLIAANARIDGHLRLTRAEVTGEVRLRGGRITGALMVDGAKLTSTTAGALQGERLQIEGDLRANDVTVAGELNLDHARIDGRLVLDDARLNAPGGTALVGYHLQVGGGLSGRAARVTGELSLRDARVAGGVLFSGARLANPGGVALRLSRAVVGGVFLSGGFAAEGVIRLTGAQIGNGLSLAGAVLHNPGGLAVEADAMRVDGSFDADRGLVVDGEVRMRGAVVTDSMRFSGGTLGNPGRMALNATGVQVERIVNCGDGFAADGEIRFVGARIGSLLTFARGRLAATGVALDAFGLQTRELDLRFAEPVGGQVSLRHATVGIVHDSPAVWPASLRLDGLTYETLQPVLRPDSRLAWLRRTGRDFASQPYEQLAAWYRGLGDDFAARTVHLAKLRHLRGTLPWPGRVWGWLQDLTVGYGYRPARAALWLVAVLLFGTAWFAAHHPAAAGTGTPPAFNPFLYALDLLLPIIDLGEQSAYPAVGTAAQLVADLLIVAGWTLATTIAAGITRALRRE
jgi:cytoskeletal protein CcmA (bactofilin family)